MSDPFVGRIIGDRYELEERIGSGAFGSVYRAAHVRLESPVAVKFLSPLLADRGETRARFEREAKTTSRLRHPNVVEVSDYGEDRELGLYIVMEYLVGETLRVRLDRTGRLDRLDLLYIAIQICDGLYAAHEADRKSVV